MAPIVFCAEFARVAIDTGWVVLANRSHSVFPEKIDSVKSVGTLCHGDWAQLKPTETGGSQPPFWTLSFPSALFTLKCTESLEWEHLMMQMKTKHRIKRSGLPLACLTIN